MFGSSDTSVFSPDSLRDSDLNIDVVGLTDEKEACAIPLLLFPVEDCGIDSSLVDECEILPEIVRSDFSSASLSFGRSFP